MMEKRQARRRSSKLPSWSALSCRWHVSITAVSSIQSDRFHVIIIEESTLHHTVLLRRDEGLGSTAMVISSEKRLFDAISATFHSYEDCCQPKAHGYLFQIFDNHRVNEFALNQFQKQDVDMVVGLVGVHLNSCHQFCFVAIGKLPDQLRVACKTASRSAGQINDRKLVDDHVSEFIL
jgi:hypothetical protein